MLVISAVIPATGSMQRSGFMGHVDEKSDLLSVIIILTVLLESSFLLSPWNNSLGCLHLYKWVSMESNDKPVTEMFFRDQLVPDIIQKCSSAV